jgi:hypothetical protein
MNSSQATYNGVCQAITQCSPEIQTLTYDQLQQRLADLTGVFPVMTDMCFESCIAFTGPFSGLLMCPECSSEWYETVTHGTKPITVPHKQALMIPVGPQIQAQYHLCKGAWNMGHWGCVMEPLLVRLHAGGSIDVYDDVYCSLILLEAAQ